MNGLLELERQIKAGRKKRARVSPKASPQNGKATAPQAYSFSAPVNYRVPGIVPAERQPSSMTCWATVTTMMMSWRDNMSMAIETALSRIGQPYVEKFRRNEGLLGSEKAPFLASAGLIAEPPMSYSLEGWERMLRTYGPLWVTTDEQPGAGFAIHARIMTGIRGNGDANTVVDIVDPAGGRQYQERFADFVRKFEEEALDPKRPLRIQVVHWPADAGAKARSATQSFALDRTIDMPPLVIPISAARRAEILQRGGWKQANIIVTAENFLGEPMQQHKIFAEFKAPGVAPVVEGGDLDGGAVSWQNIWLKPTGTVRFLAVRKDVPSLVPEGVTHYTVRDRAPLRFKLTQQHSEVTVTATTSEEAVEKIGLTGSVGVDFKIFKIGGEASTERQRSTTTTREFTWKIILPTATFVVNQV
ncbi:MAG: papain-like cysteine protease family protein [bacterium]